MSNTATIRTKGHKRVIPYVHPDNAKRVIDERDDGLIDQFAMKVAENMPVPTASSSTGSTPQPSGTEAVKLAMLENNPWIGELAKAAAVARLQMYDSDDKWAKDKDYGWGLEGSIPQGNQYFNLAYDRDTGKTYVVSSEAGRQLGELYPEMYLAQLELFKDWMEGGDGSTLPRLVPKKRSEAKDGEPWYSTTNDFLNAISAGLVGEDAKEALYELAQQQYLQEVHDDLAAGGKKYPKAIRRLMGDDWNESHPDLRSTDEDGSEVITHQLPSWDDFQAMEGEKAKQVFGTGEFTLPGTIPTFATNAVAPAVSNVAWDPELYYKTGVGEFIARGILDGAMDVASIMVPVAAAGKGATMLGRPLIGGLVGGGVGGAGTYLLGRAEDGALQLATGAGVDDQPFNFVDMGIDGAFGMLEGPLAKLRTLRGVDGMKARMLPGQASQVTAREVRDMLNAGKTTLGGNKAGWKKYVPFTKENKPLPLTLAEQKKEFEDKARREYRKAYADEAYKVNFPTMPEAGGLPVATDFGKAAGSPGVIPGSGVSTQGLVKDGKYWSLQVKGPDGKPTGVKYPMGYRRADEQELMEAFFAKNPDLAAKFNDEQKLAIGKALVKSQQKGHPFQRMFSGKKEVIPVKDWRKLESQMRPKNEIAALTGAGSELQNAGTHRMMEVRSELGKLDPSGNFKPADKKQTKMFKKMQDEVEKRKKMNMVTLDESKSAASDQFSTIGKAPLVVHKAISNALPYGSNLFLGVEPIEYTPMDTTKTENK